MINKLARWVWLGSSVLALIAGAINAVGFLSFEHHGVTHLTGSTTLLGIAIAQSDASNVIHFLAVIGAFLAGCIFSGYLVRDSTLRLGRRYGVALMLEALFLFAAVPFLDHDQPMGMYLASCACGLQNGIVSTYSGAVLRTTHVSGLFTDIGILLGQKMAGLKVDVRKLRLYFLLLTSFLTGTILGAGGFAYLGNRVLYLPAAVTGMVGLAYAVYQHQKPLHLDQKSLPNVERVRRR